MSIATTHPFTAEELMAFCDGEFSTEETQAVEIHLAECRDCAGKVRQFRETSQSLREWNAPPVSKRIEEAVAEQLQGADSGRGSRGSKETVDDCRWKCRSRIAADHGGRYSGDAVLAAGRVCAESTSFGDVCRGAGDRRTAALRRARFL